MRGRLFPFALLLLAFAAGCDGGDSPKSGGAAKNEVVIGIGQEPDSLDPLFGEMMAGAEIRGAIFRTLAMRDNTLALRPVM
ncbi:MAG: hypothetical protein QF593_09735, partial [Nitrospinota bacterium]|nr:hypothetical protein [Nitrospinota bacterium]